MSAIVVSTIIKLCRFHANNPDEPHVEKVHEFNDKMFSATFSALVSGWTEEIHSDLAFSTITFVNVSPLTPTWLIPVAAPSMTISATSINWWLAKISPFHSSTLFSNFSNAWSGKELSFVITDLDPAQIPRPERNCTVDPAFRFKPAVSPTMIRHLLTV